MLQTAALTRPCSFLFLQLLKNEATCSENLGTLLLPATGRRPGILGARLLGRRRPGVKAWERCYYPGSKATGRRPGTLGARLLGWRRPGVKAWERCYYPGSKATGRRPGNEASFKHRHAPVFFTIFYTPSHRHTLTSSYPLTSSPSHPHRE